MGKKTNQTKKLEMSKEIIKRTPIILLIQRQLPLILQCISFCILHTIYIFKTKGMTYCFVTHHDYIKLI